MRPTGKQVVGRLELFVREPRGNRFSCLSRDLELNGALRPDRLDGRLRQYTASLGNITHAKLNDIDCVQAAVDGQVEQC